MANKKVSFFCQLPKADVATIKRLARELGLPQWCVVSRALALSGRPCPESAGQRNIRFDDEQMKRDPEYRRIVKSGLGGPRRKARGKG